MNLVGQIEAALNGDALENTAVTEATTAVTTAEAEVVTATEAVTSAEAEVVTTAGLLADAEALLQAAVDASEDTTDETAAVALATTAKDAADADVITATELVATAEAVVVTAGEALTIAEGEASSEDTLSLIAQLKVTDYNMISDATMRKIMAAQGREVLFDEVENVISNTAMELVTPSLTDVTPVGK